MIYNKIIMKLFTMRTYGDSMLKIKYPEGLDWEQYCYSMNQEYGNTPIVSKYAQDTVGDFRVEYKRFENDYFGDLGKCDMSLCIATFWKGDELLFQKDISGNTMILYGDGKTLQGTYYTTTDSTRKGIDIYNLDNVLIRNTSIGYVSAKALKKVNDTYMLSNTSEPCTDSNSLGLIDMSLFFNPSYHKVSVRPYDNARIGIEVDCDILPVEATHEGFVIKNIKRHDLEYPILLYEDVEKFDFYPDFYSDDSTSEGLTTYENNFEFTSDPTCTEFNCNSF